MRRPKFTRWLTPFLLLGMASLVEAQVAYDSFFASAVSTDAGDITVACTPVGTPRGVEVRVNSGSNADQVTGVTYGGVTMTEAAGSPLIKTSTEIMTTHVFYLGASIPTGVQDCIVDRSGSTSMVVGVTLLTASTNTEIVDTTTVQSAPGGGAGLSTDPVAALSLGGRTCFCSIGFVSGKGATTDDVNGITPLASWTSRHEEDHGAYVSGIYTYDTIGTTDVTAGWTQSDDDANGIAIAVSEIAAAVPTVTTAAIVPTTATVADGGGNVTNDGGSTVTARGVCWNTTGTPTISDTCTSDGTGTGAFTSTLTPLVGTTTYYVRAYGTNTTGTGYGGVVSFLTRAASDTMTVARVHTGPAPLLVIFDVFEDARIILDADNGSGDPDPGVGYWLWDFGDYGAGTWSTTSKSKNTATGMVSAHVYELPGSYVASLKHWTADGTLAEYTETITVTDPDDVYTTTLYYSSSGSDSNACTIASPCLTATQAFGTDATKGLFGAAGPRRVLFKRGESFDKTSTTSHSSLVGPFHAGTYGDDLAADPIINVADGIQALVFSNSVTGVRVVDLDIRGPAIGFGLLQTDFTTADASWAEGAGWVTASGFLTGTAAATATTQTATNMTVGNPYEVTYSIPAYTSGTVAVSLGTAVGASEGSLSAFTEQITCAGSNVVSFTGAAFTGSVDDLFIVTNLPAIRIPNDSLFLRVSVDRFSSAFSVTDGLRSGTGIVDCTLGSNLTSYGIYWAVGYQSAILGNTITTNKIYNNEHTIRQYISHGVVSHNNLVGGGRGKTNMRMAGYYPPTGLTNDTFTGSASSWTVGTGWAWHAGTATVEHTAGNTAVLSQTVSNGATGLPKTFTFTVSNRTAGSVAIQYGGTAGASQSTNATFTEDINPTSGALLEFVPTSDFDGRVDFTATASILDMDTLRGTEEPTTWLEYTWVTDNILAPSSNLSFIAAGGVGTPFMFGVTNSGDAQYARNCVVERNKITVGDGNQAAIESDAANYFTYRNNVFDMSADPGTVGIRIRRSGSSSLTATGNAALNTTIYSSASFAGTGISAAAAPSADDSIVRNTHLIKNGGAGAAVSPSATDSDTTVTDTATDTATTGALAAAILDLRPSATSNARGVGFANASAAASYVRDTYDRITKFTTRNEAGAYEIGFTIPGTVTSEVFRVGINRDDCEYDSTDYAFVDLMQMSGNTSSPYGWDTVDDGTFGANTGDITDFVDVDGWPKVTIPFDGGDGLAVLRKRFRSPLTGLHTVLFDGAGTLVFTGAASATVTTSGTTINITTADTDVILDLTVTNASNLIKNIKCILPNYEATYTTAPYYPESIEKLEAIPRAGQRLVFRSMNWRRTNGDKPTSPIDETTWDRRSTLTKHTQGSSFGVAWEHCARLSNELNADLWVSVPHQATEGYTRSLAQLMLGELDSDALLIVEPSNEASWNTSFDQAGYFQTLGDTQGFTGTAAQKGRKSYSKFLAETADIFLTEWGEANAHRLRFVIGTQASNTAVTDNLMDYIEEVTLDSIPLNPHQTRIHFCGLAPYAGLHTTTADRFGDDAVDEGWYLTDSPVNAAARISATYMPLAFTNMDNQIASLAVYAATASKPYTSIQPVCYEMGYSLVSSGANQGNSDLTTFIQQVSNTPTMLGITKSYITGWNTRGGTLTCWFHLCAARTGTNAWGALSHIDNTTVSEPQYRALIGAGGAVISFRSTIISAGYYRLFIRRAH